jgi:hypothetical protein
MNLQEIINHLNLVPLTRTTDFQTLNPVSGYMSDLLSCVMSGAPRKAVWITLQSHSNVIAVATLLELSAVIITENAQPDQATLDKANEEGVNLLSTSLSSFEVAGRLWELGLRATPKE